MTDIVERLRKRMIAPRGSSTLMDEAADEIERLRGMLTAITFKELKLADETERLRKIVCLADPGGQVRAKLDYEETGTLNSDDISVLLEYLGKR